MVIIVIVNQGSEDPYPVFSCLINSPVNGIECLLVIDSQLRHHAQWVSNTDTQSLASDGPRAHRIEGIHDFRDSAMGWVAGIEFFVEWLSFRRDHVLVQP